MILTTGQLVNKLKMDEFITVELDGKEYIIDFVKHVPNYTDHLGAHVCLVCRDGGDGTIKR